MKKNEIPKLSCEELENQLWETLHAVKNKKLSKDGAQGVAAMSNAILNLQKLKLQVSKQAKEIGTPEKVLIGTKE